MMKSEFENLAGRAVTDEQYRAIEILYMSSNLEKAEFVKSMRPMLKNIPQPEKKKDIKRMAVRDHSGFRKTPNGCYYHIEYVELASFINRNLSCYKYPCTGVHFTFFKVFHVLVINSAFFIMISAFFMVCHALPLHFLEQLMHNTSIILRHDSTL